MRIMSENSQMYKELAKNIDIEAIITKIFKPFTKNDLNKFLKEFRKISNDNKLCFYFMTAHPGSTIKEAKELRKKAKDSLASRKQ